jgi:hypothetical protein
MKKQISIAVLVVALAICLPAGLSAQEEERERTLKIPEKRIGLIVNFSGLAGNLIEQHDDGMQMGPAGAPTRGSVSAAPMCSTLCSAGSLHIWAPSSG